MLKNQSKSYVVNQSSIDKERLYSRLFEFIGQHISDFKTYLNDYGEKVKGENQITGKLELFFRDKISEDELPYIFQNQYSYSDSKRTSDIGIIVKQFSRQKAFCIIEAKRLCENKHSDEYVFGKRGGIERFKRGFHAAYLPYAVMIGYIQKQDAGYWHKRVNNKIEALSQINIDKSIDWNSNEKLSSGISNLFYYKYESVSLRRKAETIKLHHFWIDI